MAHPSAHDRLAQFGPPNGDFARYVQALSDALATTQPHTAMVQLTSRPIPAAAPRPAAPASRAPLQASAGAQPGAAFKSPVATSYSTAPGTTRVPTSAPQSAPLNKPAATAAIPAAYQRPTTPAELTDDEDFDDEDEEDDESAKPLTDEQIASLRQALAAQESAASESSVVRNTGRLLTGAGVALLLWVFFGNGGGLSVFFAIAALFLGSRLRSA
jgi:hypothetical protein